MTTPKKPQFVFPGILPIMLGLPGTVGSTCEYDCPHVQCRRIRHEARAPCYYCRSPIGYGVPYYRIELGKGKFYKNGSKPLRRFHKSCHLEFARQYAEIKRLLNRYKDGKESGLDKVRGQIPREKQKYRPRKEKPHVEVQRDQDRYSQQGESDQGHT